MPSQDSRSDIVIVGTGTLGSTLFQQLAREAIGTPWAAEATVFLIDHDVVEAHNVPKSSVYRHGDVGCHKVRVLQRWAQEVNPDLTVVSLAQRVEGVGLGPFLHTAVTLIAADTYCGKMSASRQVWRSGVPLILIGEMAGGHSLASRFRRFQPGPRSPCLECNWDREYLYLEHPFPCVQPANPGPPTRLTVAARTAAFMVEEALRFLSDGAADLGAVEVRIDPERRCLVTFRPTYNPACLFDHQRLDRSALIYLSQRVEALTVGQAFALAAQYLPNLSHLKLSQEVATKFACQGTHEWEGLASLSSPVPLCPTCGAQGMPVELTFHLTPVLATAGNDTSLAALVPPADVLTFENTAGETIHLALAPPSNWRAMCQTHRGQQ